MQIKKSLFKVSLLLLFFNFLFASEKDRSYTINFQDVPVVEFIQFVSRVSNVNFIFNHRDLQFNITLASGKSVSSEQLVKALVQVLRTHGMAIYEEDGYLVIHKASSDEPSSFMNYDKVENSVADEKFIASLQSLPYIGSPHETKPRFLVHKLKYHTGEEIEETIKKITADLLTKPETSSRYLKVLKSVQWIKATNSLIFSGDEESLANVQQLIQSLDTPLSQVFIEVLVVETDARNTIDFGLQWGAGGKVNEALGFGLGNFKSERKGSSFASTFKDIGPANPPSGQSQIPLGRGFDIGMIGNLLWHKGSVYASLAALVSALQSDNDSKIVLNQKIIAQDNKTSTLFVGDNIPFTGSIVSTVGTHQQTTANLEYRDIGVTLQITPRLGDGNVVTLEVKHDISEAVPTEFSSVSASQVSGIQTTKTNMATNAHVPDGCFFVLSGSVRNAKRNHKEGLPCLGGLPLIGSLFSQTYKYDDKRNIIIFVRPHIVRSAEDYQRITEKQEEFLQKDSSGIEMHPLIRSIKEWDP